MPQLYRVREAFNGDDCDMSQFSYIHDKSVIKRRRFNKSGEQVLYTSSYPHVAVLETEISTSNYFYISRWKKKNVKDTFLSFFSVDDNCSKDTMALSRQVRMELERIFSVEEQCQIDEIRDILEKDYFGLPESMRYEESSNLASEILKKAECIISYSKKDDRHLNITFSKKAVDEKLSLDCVFYCVRPKNYRSLCYDVEKIGFVDNGKIVWYHWEIDESSIYLPLPIPQKQIHEAIQISKKTMCVNVNFDVFSWQTGILCVNGVNYTVQFKIKIRPIQ